MYDKITEVTKNIDVIEEVAKFNPNHGEDGKFTSAKGGGASATGLKVDAKTKDKIIDAKIKGNKYQTADTKQQAVWKPKQNANDKPGSVDGSGAFKPKQNDTKLVYNKPKKQEPSWDKMPGTREGEKLVYKPKEEYQLIRTKKSADIDEIEHVEKFNPFHDSRGRFSSARGMKSYSANPKTKAGQMAINRSSSAGYTQVLNIHRESKGETIGQNDLWLKTGIKPPSHVLQANASRAASQKQWRQAQNQTAKIRNNPQAQAQIQQRKQQWKQNQQNQQNQQAQQTQNGNILNVKQKMKSGVTMDADFDTTNVAGAKNKEFRGTAQGKDLTSTFDCRGMKATDSYAGEDRFTDKVADMQGFNSPPKVVSKSEFASLASACGDEMFRTWGPGVIDGNSVDGNGFMKNFATNNDMKMNGDRGRAYGDGYYAASAKRNADDNGRSSYNLLDVSAAQYSSQWYGDGVSTTRMTWLSKPNIVSEKKLNREWNKLSSTEKAKFGNHVNTYACAKGYDAVVNGKKGNDYMTIFNRSKLAICEGYEGK